LRSASHKVPTMSHILYPSGIAQIPKKWEINYAPSLEASSGLISKMSIPSIFPKSSNLSRPVACSMSVGTVPGAAPGGRRSDSVLTSAKQIVRKIILMHQVMCRGRVFLCGYWSWKKRCHGSSVSTQPEDR